MSKQANSSSALKQLLTLYHEQNAQGNSQAAAATLALAMKIPTYKGEAFLCKGIDFLKKGNFDKAFIFISQAVQFLPERSDVTALLAHVIKEIKPELAISWLEEAVRRKPLDSVLRKSLWLTYAESEAIPFSTIEKNVLSYLSEIQDPQELKVIVDLLRKRTDYKERIIGVVDFSPLSRSVTGWVIDLRQPDIPVEFKIKIGNKLQSFVAEGAHPVLVQAGISKKCGLINLDIPVTEQTFSLHVIVDKRELLGSPLAIFPYFDPHKICKDSKSKELSFNKEPVDILIPVYLGKNETLACIESVLKYRKSNVISHRIIVLDDASPDIELVAQLKRLANAGKIKYIRQPANLGFIRNMNRGMSLNARSDVVWLNADTRVHGNWLDRLHKIAYSAHDIASVTPFTNNGELMSFPVSRVSHTIPDDQQHAELDMLAQQLDEPAVTLETGCGFCFYIKRAALNTVGYLDELELKRGYGEETDWCLRASAYGWRHVGAVNTFVAHQGGISFGAEKQLRVAYNNNLLRKRYPLAENNYRRFCNLDPLSGARTALQRARIKKNTSSMGRVLHVFPKDFTHDTYDAELIYYNMGQLSKVMLTVLERGSNLPILMGYTLPLEYNQLLIDLEFFNFSKINFTCGSNFPRVLTKLPVDLCIEYDVESVSWNTLSEQSFLCAASQVGLPWNALLSFYKSNYLDINWVVTKKEKIFFPSSFPVCDVVNCFLIADVFFSKESILVEKWLSFIEKMKLKNADVTFLLPKTTPVEITLQQANVLVVPSLDGMSKKDFVHLANCVAAISLENMPDIGWIAAEIASTYSLPLYAPKNLISEEAGALPLSDLILNMGLVIHDV